MIGSSLALALSFCLSVSVSTVIPSNSFLALAKLKGSGPIGPYVYGSKVMTDDINLYYLYYGNWSQSEMAFLTDFSNNIGDSSWYSTTKEYYYQESAQSKKVFVNGKVDAGSKGDHLSGSALPELVQYQIDQKVFPEDPNGIYYVLTSKEIKESVEDGTHGGFCKGYLGYHSTTTLKSGKEVAYAMIGNCDQCIDDLFRRHPSYPRTTPNGAAGLDITISTIAHELTETVSNVGGGWGSADGNENADLCAWDFGLMDTDIDHDTQATSSYNIVLSNGKKYILQQNWSPVQQKCVMKV